MKREEYIGKRFGRLVVKNVDADMTAKRKQTYFLCECDCGNHKSVSISNLRSGCTRSCGCYAREIVTKHGLSGTRIADIYRSMVHRCNAPHDHAYADYGGRGIKMCDEWLNDPMAFIKWCYENGYDDGEDDAVMNNGFGGQFDDECNYKGKKKEEYKNGYEEGYEAGYYDNKVSDK